MSGSEQRIRWWQWIAALPLIAALVLVRLYGKLDNTLRKRGI